MAVSGRNLGGNQWVLTWPAQSRQTRVLGLPQRDRARPARKGGEVSICEVGYVFERSLEFCRSALDQSPGGTFMIRWGSRY